MPSAQIPGEISASCLSQGRMLLCIPWRRSSSGLKCCFSPSGYPHPKALPMENIRGWPQAVQDPPNFASSSYKFWCKLVKQLWVRLFPRLDFVGVVDPRLPWVKNELFLHVCWINFNSEQLVPSSLMQSTRLPVPAQGREGAAGSGGGFFLAQVPIPVSLKPLWNSGWDLRSIEADLRPPEERRAVIPACLVPSLFPCVQDLGKKREFGVFFSSFRVRLPKFFVFWSLFSPNSLSQQAGSSHIPL